MAGSKHSPDSIFPPSAQVLLFVVLAALLVWFRRHAFALPLEVDECIYAYAGERLLAGDRLYVDIWDHHPFGGYALFAAAIALAGNQPEVFRWMAIGFSIISLGLIWAIARRTGGAAAAVVAAALFALASSDPGTAGEGCNREIYMTTLLLAAWWLAGTPTPPTRAGVLLAGAMIALASAFKMVAAVHWCALAAYLAWAHHKRGDWRRVVGRLLVFALAPLVLWVATGAYFAATGRWADFLDATVHFNLGYAAGSGGFRRFLRFFAPGQQSQVFASALPLWIAAAAAGAGYLLPQMAERRRQVLALVLFAIASYVAVCLPGRFFAHYYYLMIAPLVLLVAAACAHWGAVWTSVRRRSPARLLPGLMVIGALAASESVHYLSQPPFGITVGRYHGRDFWGRAIGAMLARVTAPDDFVFVYGNDAEIYYYSGRRCASRHVMLVGLEEGSRNLELHRRQLISDLRRNLPRVILVLFDHPPFPEWKAFLDEHYGEPVAFAFDERDRTQVIMFVFADPRRPIETVDWNWDRTVEGGWFPARKR